MVSVLLKSHKSTSFSGSLPMHVLCSVDALENSPKISHRMPPQTIEWFEKRTKESMPRLVGILECVLQCSLSASWKDFLKGTHRVPVWAIHPLAKSIVVNKVSWDKMCQNCSLSSWDFVMAHNSDLVTICIPLALADGNSEGLWLILFSFIWLCAISL